MATKTLNVVLVNAYATEAEWIQRNPILYAGQDAISIDRFGMRKTGDGSSHWADLPYNKNAPLILNGTQYDGASEQHINLLPLVIGTQTSATGTWTGTINTNTLEDGMSIRYWLPRSGSGNATLNLTLGNGTTTGAKNCYYGGTTRLTTHYQAGNMIILTYFKAANINGTTYEGWWSQSNYDSNSYYRLRYEQPIKAASAIVAGNLIVSNGTSGYFHLKTGDAFDITYPVLCANSAISSGSTSTNTYTMIPISVTSTQSITLTAYKPVFIKGTLSGTTLIPESNAPLTQTLPTSEDGYVYLYIGMAYSTSSLYLLPDQKLYRYLNGRFSAYAPNAERAYYDGNGNVIVKKYVSVDTTQTVTGTKTFSAVTDFTNTTDSTSTTTGAVQIAGGLGVAKTISADKIAVKNKWSIEVDASTNALKFVIK